ncbi:hypothetical protein [Microlunatus antarcticus]|uniref:Uncharacterized protein n=1 Tax=Microlunatus antarcticus TaxID=53388 RepID=A0A7W5P8N2_9ACTN|nr:hypothetical protein [Microlunatus antarcticus]MBB3328834.1 hypothetical protein [Microlunatus antarcticus]
MLLQCQIPEDCSPDYLLSLIPPARGAWLDRRLAGTGLVVRSNGSDHDRQLARDEIQAALAQANSLTTTIELREA